MIDDKIKIRLKRLFAVAENDASTDGEIENAMRAARNLMSQHQIERDDIFETDDGEVCTTNVVFGRSSCYSMYSSICSWESYICRFISDFVGNVGFYIQNGILRRNSAGMATKGKATKITFYGPELDVQFCIELYDEICCFVTASAKLKFGNALARGEAAAYAEGFAHGLWEANKKETRVLEEASQGGDKNALMVINRSLTVKKDAKKWLSTECGLKLGKGRPLPSMALKDFGAYAEGKSDGADYKPASRRKARLLE